MTCFTSGHLYHMQFAIPAAQNPSCSMAPSDFSSSAQGFLIYIAAGGRESLTKSYSVHFLNWWRHPSPSRIYTTPEPLTCMLFHGERRHGINPPINRTGASDLETSHKCGIGATWALTLWHGTFVSPKCNMGHTNAHTVRGQPPLRTNFKSLQQKMKDTTAIRKHKKHNLLLPLAFSLGQVPWGVLMQKWLLQNRLSYRQQIQWEGGNILRLESDSFKG